MTKIIMPCTDDDDVPVIVCKDCGTSAECCDDCYPEACYCCECGPKHRDDPAMIAIGQGPQGE